MKIKDELIKRILKETWCLRVEQRGIFDYDIFFEEDRDQIIIRNLGNEKIIDFADKDSLEISSMDNDVLIITGKKLNDYDSRVKWTLLEIGHDD